MPCCLAAAITPTTTGEVMRGFGTTFDLETGRVRHWFSGPDGVKKWADASELVPDELRPDYDDEREDET